jgi:hypothetical protein
MDRKQALSAAGAIAVAMGTAGIAFGVSFGVLGLDAPAPKIGRLTPIDATVVPPAAPTTTAVRTPPPSDPSTATPTAPEVRADDDSPQADAAPVVVADARPEHATEGHADDDD